MMVKAKDTRIEQANRIFESITCLVAEGPEFHTCSKLLEYIGKEAMKGYELTLTRGGTGCI